MLLPFSHASNREDQMITLKVTPEQLDLILETIDRRFDQSKAPESDALYNLHFEIEIQTDDQRRGA